MNLEFPSHPTFAVDALVQKDLTVAQFTNKSYLPCLGGL
jgi:hypothetical protein